MLQIGGVGQVSGDDGGGSYLAQRVYRSIYESFYRCGRPTLMTGLLFAQLGIVSPEELIERHVDDAIDHGLAVRTAFDAAARYDPEALALLEHVGTSLGRSVVGATRRLDFPAAEPIEVVLAGSVHVKGSNPTLRLAFEHTVRAELDGRVNFHVLKEPPVAGAVFWAMERGGIEPGADLRRRVLGSLMMN
jgi:N-acetylglucosamine kinase-like BadF-type ATPase